MSSEPDHDAYALTGVSQSPAEELLERVSRDSRELVRKLIIGEAIAERPQMGALPQRHRAAGEKR